MEQVLNQTTQLQYALDTFYFLVMGALVMWMAAGFAMLEAGLVRAKNTTEILTKNVVLYTVACVMFMICGYQLMYGGGFFLDGLALDGAASADVLVESVLAESSARDGGFTGTATYANAADFFFQVVFVATAMSIVSGAVAERMKLWSFLLFAVVMTAFIYPVEGSWTWGSDGLFGINLDSRFGFSDFAGSGIVHLAGASAALAGVLLLGPRAGKYGPNGQVNAFPGANLPLATLGTLILWLGWFGFNGGSQLKLGDIANANAVAMVFVNTNMAAAGGVLGALVLAKILFRKADLTMALNGALAGLVAITANPANPTPLQATVFGALAGVLVVLSILMLDRLRIDDPVGAISVHGICGLFGLLIVPITHPTATLLGQLIGGAAIFFWVFCVSLVTWFAIRVALGLRVSEEEEFEGVARVECGMDAYPEFHK